MTMLSTASIATMEQTHSAGTTANLIGNTTSRILPSGIAAGGWRDDWVAHSAVWGPLPAAGDHGDLVASIRAIELTGRGGGHFPTAVKLQAAIASGPGGSVVINAAEGEPASGKDSVLWQYRPHLVLDGAVVVAQAMGAREIVVWLSADAVATRVSIEQAIAERAPAGVAEPVIRLLLAPESYVSGESSAVIAGVRGFPVAPTFVIDPARPWGEGPAILVHNTETMARIGALSHTGADNYPATNVITVAQPILSGREYERAVLEVPGPSTIADALGLAGVGQAHAILLGGFAGSWHGIEEASDLPLDHQLLRQRGLSLGAGIIIALPESIDVFQEATAIADFLADSSAGQCGPCVFGMPALVKSLKRQRVSEALDLADVIEGRGGCRMPDGAIRMIRSAIAYDRRRSTSARVFRREKARGEGEF